MLVIDRTTDESFTVGQAKITILKFMQDANGHIKVRIGIEAPTHIAVLRDNAKKRETP